MRWSGGDRRRIACFLSPSYIKIYQTVAVQIKIYAFTVLRAQSVSLFTSQYSRFCLGMSVRVADGVGDDIFSDDLGSDDEITLFPDSASVVGVSERGVPLLRRNTAVEGLTFYGNGSRGRVSHSDLGVVWRRTEPVFYFSVAVVIFVVLVFFLYFAYTYLAVVRRGHNATRGDRSGARWTRMTERP